MFHMIKTDLSILHPERGKLENIKFNIKLHGICSIKSILLFYTFKYQYLALVMWPVQSPHFYISVDHSFLGRVHPGYSDGGHQWICKNERRSFVLFCFLFFFLNLCTCSITCIEYHLARIDSEINECFFTLQLLIRSVLAVLLCIALKDASALSKHDIYIFMFTMKHLIFIHSLK